MASQCSFGNFKRLLTHVTAGVRFLQLSAALTLDNPPVENGPRVFRIVGRTLALGQSAGAGASAKQLWSLGTTSQQTAGWGTEGSRHSGTIWDCKMLDPTVRLRAMRLEGLSVTLAWMLNRDDWHHMRCGWLISGPGLDLEQMASSPASSELEATSNFSPERA